MAYSEFLRGSRGHGAIGSTLRKIHQDRIHGKIKLTAGQERELDTALKEKFVKDGKDPYKIREKNVEEVFNRLKMNRDDLIPSNKVNEIEGDLHIEHRTNRVEDIDE